MEIRRILWGDTTGVSGSAYPARKTESSPSASTPTADRLELTHSLTQVMEEQRARLEAALSRPAGQEEKDEGGLLGYMETEEDKLDALSEELDVQMKCLKIAMNMMRGKKVPPEDEKYLMEHDPDGYKMAIAMKVLVKEDKKECESVLDDEDRNGESTQSADGGEPAATETASGEGGEAE